MHDRQQQTSGNGIISGMTFIHCGVHQGSIVGPLIF